MRVRQCVTIDAPPADVWADVKHLDRHVEWMRDARSIRFRTRRRTGVGTELECVGGGLGEIAAWPVLRAIWKGNLRRLQARLERGG